METIGREFMRLNEVAASKTYNCHYVKLHLPHQAQLCELIVPRARLQDAYAFKRFF